jgi:hypothetical protein
VKREAHRCDPRDNPGFGKSETSTTGGVAAERAKIRLRREETQRMRPKQGFSHCKNVLLNTAQTNIVSAKRF